MELGTILERHDLTYIYYKELDSNRHRLFCNETKTIVDVLTSRLEEDFVVVSKPTEICESQEYFIQGSTRLSTVLEGIKKYISESLYEELLECRTVEDFRELIEVNLKKDLTEQQRFILRASYLIEEDKMKLIEEKKLLITSYEESLRAFESTENKHVKHALSEEVKDYSEKLRILDASMFWVV